MYKRKPVFLRGLNKHEKELVRCCAAGIDCDFGDERPEPDDETAPTIRAELIRYLLLGGDEKHPVDPIGVRISGARITGVLNLEGCPNLPTLGLLYCDIAGTPTLLDARGKTFNFGGSRLPGIEADRLKTTGSVFLRDGFEATGEVRLPGAEIGGILDCTGGTFNGEPTSLNADGLKTLSRVFLSDGFEAKEEVKLLGAEISGDLACDGGTFNGVPTALGLSGAEITGTFFLRNLEAPPEGCVDLYAARVGSICDDPKSWPEKPGDFILNGFRYDRFAESVTDYDSRRDWLERQDPDHLTHDFAPQPFEQLAKVLREMGHVEEAKDIAILKLRYQRDTSWRYGKKTIYDRVTFGWGHAFDWLVRFGYRPFLALRYAGIFIVLGALLFGWAGHSVDMVPNNPFLLKSEWKAALSATDPYEAFHWSVPGFQTFSPLFYSIDTFVPLVNLHQEPHWIPSAETWKGWAIRIYLWIHIAAGWIITTLFAASLAGVVKRD